MKIYRLLLLAFMVFGFLSQVLLLVFNAMRFALPKYLLQPLNPTLPPWFLGTGVLVLLPCVVSREWLLAHRAPLLVGAILWPFLDGFLALNDLSVLEDAPWPMNEIILASLLITSLLGILASFPCSKSKERETAFLYSVLIGVFAVWEYWRFGNFGYAFFSFTGLMVPRCLSSNRDI